MKLYPLPAIKPNNPKVARINCEKHRNHKSVLAKVQSRYESIMPLLITGVMN